jgi:hypothetical protein
MPPGGRLKQLQHPANSGPWNHRQGGRWNDRSARAAVVRVLCLVGKSSASTAIRLARHRSLTNDSSLRSQTRRTARGCGRARERPRIGGGGAWSAAWRKPSRRWRHSSGRWKTILGR